MDPSQLADLKGLHDAPTPLGDILLAAGLLGLLLGGIALLFWLNKRSRRGIPGEEPHRGVPEVHWGVAAKQEWNSLRAQSPQGLEQMRAVYFRLVSLVKLCLEKETGVNATDLTSHEILLRIAGCVDEGRLQGIREFFSASDMLLFAKAPLEVERWERDLNWAQELFQFALRADDERQRAVGQTSEVSGSAPGVRGDTLEEST